MKKLLYLLAFLVSGAMAAEISPTTKQELIDNFSGGLNTSIPSHKIAKNYSPYMRNVFIDDGMIERINGFVTLGSSMTLMKVTGIFPFNRESGQTSFLVTDSSLTLETSDFKTWVMVSSVANTSSLLTWMQVRNKMWGFNGLDSVITWDGTNKVTLNGGLSAGIATPNVPKFRYGAYYQDRVWGYSIPNGASDLYFTSVIGTDNVILAPDNQFAWPTAINVVYVGRGDGTIGTALWTYQSLLRAGKERSIYSIYGDNPSNYKPNREEASVGVTSNESVRVLDGKSYFIGPDGIYNNSQRISDLIEPDVAAMNNNATSIVSNLWETQADFNRGLVNIDGARATAAGTLTISTGPFFINYNTVTVGALVGNTLASSSYTFPSAGGSTAFAARVASETIPSTFAGYVDASVTAIFAWMKCDNCSADTFNIIAEIKNLRTGLSVSYNNDHSVTGAFSQTQLFAANGSAVPFTADDFNSGNFTIKMTVGPPGTPGNKLAIFPSTTTGLSDIKITQTGAQNAQFISDVATLTTVTAWGNFNSVNNTNTGSISFYLRTSTSVINITTQTWKSVSPGATINEPIINRFIQWATTMTDVSYLNLPIIDNVEISHIEGQTTEARPFAIDWNNRYWLTTTTTTNNNLRLIYVKSKITNENPNAWMPIDAYPIDCFAKTSSVLYGGSTSTGAVYRLDYGTNLDGRAIVSAYDTPDLSLNDYFFNKNILKYLIDGTKSIGGDMVVQSSVNQAAFTSSTFSITGAGRYTHIVEGVTRPVKTLRLRLQNGQTDIGLGINNVNILYEDTRALSNQ